MNSKKRKTEKWEMEIKCPKCSQEIVLNGIIMEVDIISLYKKDFIEKILENSKKLKSKEDILCYLEKLKNEYDYLKESGLHKEEQRK